MLLTVCFVLLYHLLFFAFCDGDLTPQLFSETFSVQNVSENIADQTATKYPPKMAIEAGFNVVQLNETEEIKTILSSSYKHTKSFTLFPRILQLKTKAVYKNISMQLSPHLKHTSYVSSSTIKVSTESSVNKTHTDPNKLTANIFATPSFKPSIILFSSIFNTKIPTQNKSITLENTSFSETPLLSHSPIYSSHPNYFTPDKRTVDRTTLFIDDDNSIKKKPLHTINSVLKNVSNYKVIASRNFVSVTNISTVSFSTDRVFLLLVSSYLRHEYLPFMSFVKSYSPSMSTIEKYSSYTPTIKKYLPYMSTIEKSVKIVLTDSSNVLYKFHTISSAMEKSFKTKLNNFTTISSTDSLLKDVLDDMLTVVESQVTSSFKLPNSLVKSSVFAPKVLITTSSVLKLKNSIGILPTDILLMSTTKHQTLFPLILQSTSISISHESIQVSLQAPYNAKKLMKIVIFVQEFHPKYSDFKKVSTWYNVSANEIFRYHKYCAIVIEQSEINMLLHGEQFVHFNRFSFDIGVESCFNQNTFVCNGPLKPSHGYRMQVEFHFNGNLSTETYFTVTYHTNNKITKPILSPDSLGSNVIILIVLCGVLFFFLIVFAIVFYRRYHRTRESPYTNKPENLRSTLMSPCQKKSSGRRRLDLHLESEKSIKGMTRPVSVRDFKAWVDRSSSDSAYRFAEEFESMRDVGKSERHEVADISENRRKNRYTNVLPYDYTRVKLSSIDDEPGSDYINANYIHGYKNPRAYIATQGPLPCTTEDFWRMTWEQNSRVIVMLTQYVERGRVKCHQYWPTITPVKYGDVTVTRLNEYIYPEWIEREFLLQCEGERRTVHHCQYTAWPDHGVPKSSNELLQFIQTVRHLQQPKDGPLICHCSAGVGRTGTYLCADIILNKLQVENSIDVYGVVSVMRTQRCSMVQTEDQYIFIHRVILDYLNQKDETEHIFILQRGLLTNEGNRRSIFRLGEGDVEKASEALLGNETQCDILEKNLPEDTEKKINNPDDSNQRDT